MEWEICAVVFLAYGFRHVNILYKQLEWYQKRLNVSVILNNVYIFIHFWLTRQLAWTLLLYLLSFRSIAYLLQLLWLLVFYRNPTFAILTWLPFPPFSIFRFIFNYFRTITKQVIQLIFIMLVGKPECPEETHLSDLVTTWPSHKPTPCIEAGSHYITLTLRQPDSQFSDWVHT